MNLNFKPNLKLKIFLSVALLYLAAIVSLTFLTIRFQRNALLAQMVERAKVGIRLMELSVTGALYNLDTFRLETIAREAKSLPDVDYAYIFDRQGRIVGDYHPDQNQLFSTFTDPLAKEIVSSERTTVHILEQDGIVDISRPIRLGHEKLGGVRLGFDLKPVLEDFKEVILRAVGVSTAVFFLGLAVIFIITRQMTQPIGHLTVAANRIAKGDMQYRVPSEREDELGTLAKAFNQMAEELMRREVELEASQRIIRRADRLSSLGQLTAGLAHEIRNPLVAIRTFTQLLPERYEDAEFRNDFQAVALREVDRICGLVTDLLSFARPSPPNIAAENVNEIVDSTVRLLETEAKEKGVELRRGLDTHLPKIFVDKEQIKQVLMNIILNAIQSIEGEGFVEVSTKEFIENGKPGMVRIGIRDSGIGIPEKDVENIFDPFFTTKKDGSGLGLSISHQIIKEHGGQILVKSAVGAGTRFDIDLPVGAQE